jgi:hypothetical protein
MRVRTTSRALCATILSLGLGLAACGDDGNTDPEPDAPPNGLQVTLVQGGNFAGPESARWDSANNVWYVSNLGEAFGAEDQPGWITRLNADGTVADEKWIADLGTPVGMAILGGSLYVADSNAIKIIDIATATVTETINVPGAAFLNDVAAGNGKIYVSDTFGNKIYEFTPGEQAAQLLVEGAELDFPNGLYVRQNELVIAALGEFGNDNDLGSLMTYAFDGGEITPLGTLEGRFDGVEADGQDLLITDFTGKLYSVKSTGEYTLIVDLVADHGFMSAADLGWDPARRMVVMPDLSGFQVGIFTIP